MGVEPKIGVPQNGWFISWKTLLIKMDDLGEPLFLETTKSTLTVAKLGRIYIEEGFCPKKTEK